MALANYRRLARRLRRAVAIDRPAYLDSLVAEVAQGILGDRKSEQHYMSLWRACFHRRSASEQIHSFRVLHEARGLPPPLALARAPDQLCKACAYT